MAIFLEKLKKFFHVFLKEILWNLLFFFQRPYCNVHGEENQLLLKNFSWKFLRSFWKLLKTIHGVLYFFIVF